MATKIIFHQIKKGVNCPDGIAAAWVARKAHPEAEVIGCYYQCPAEDIPQIAPGDRLIIVDFSFPAEQMKEWEEMGCDITLIDHHKTAQEHLLGHAHTLSSKIIFDMDECGATLAWKHFFPDQLMPIFLAYVKERDLWTKGVVYCDEVHEAISKLGRTFELMDVLATFDRPYDFQILGRVGKSLMASKRQAIVAAADRVQTCDLTGEGIPIPYVSLAKDGSEDRLVSDICHELYKNRYPDAIFVACVTSEGTWSLRSDKDKPDGGFDVGAFARSFGGGGHHNASGFKPTSD